MLYPEQVMRNKSILSPPPPPPRTRKGSNFPLQVFGTRLFKTHPEHRRTKLFLGNVKGSIGCLVPVEEKMFKRLALLQQIMSLLLPTPFALNPKEYRDPKRFSQTPKDCATYNSNKRFVLDGCLIYRFLTLNTALQDELASIMGTSAFIIRENLHELDYLSRSF